MACEARRTRAGSLPLYGHPFGYFWVFSGQHYSEFTKAFVCLKHQLQPSPRPKWLTERTLRGGTYPAHPTVLPTHLGKHLRFRARNDQARPAFYPGWGVRELSCEYEGERGGGSEGMWPYVAYDPQLSSPSPLKPSLVMGSACATSRVCPKCTIPSIFAGLVLIHLTASRPKIYTAAIPTFIYFINKRFYSFILPLLLSSSTRNLFC